LLSGQLASVFLIAILDAALISWITLRWYRRRVRKLMQPDRPSPAPAPAGDIVTVSSASSPPAAAPVAPLTVAMFQPRDIPSNMRERGAASGASKRLAAAYCIGAALHSAIITTFFLRFDWSLPPAAWFAQWWVFAWPIVPTLAVVLVLNRRQTIRLTVGYVLSGSLGVAVITLVGQLLRGTIDDASFTNVYWYAANLALTASLPLALLLITGWRRIRAVTPLALSTTLVFGFALLLFRELLASAFNLEAVQSMVLAAVALTSVEAAYYGAFMILVLPVGWVAWRLLQLLAMRFESKRFSDVQLVVDCWWLIVTAEALAVHLATNYGLGGIAAGVVAFAVYRIGVAIALLRRPQRIDAPAKRLLLSRRHAGVCERAPRRTIHRDTGRCGAAPGRARHAARS
jgi:hypothetical protein